MALTAPAGKLAIRLSQAGLSEQASRALDVARNGLQEAQKHGLTYGPYVREPEDVLAGRRRPQVVLNHRRQADNALRLGVIDAERYQKILERLAYSASAEEAKEERLREFLAGGGFLRDLPTDHVALGKTPKSHLVPEPGYYVTRIAQLTDDQQAEYSIAFSDRTTLHLVRKYTFVRLMSLLESVLFFPGQIDERAAEREIQLMASLHDGSAGFYGREAGDVIAELSQQTLPERQVRAKLLREIDQRNERFSGGFTLTIGGVTALGTPLSADYFRMIRLSIDDLRTMLRTGRVPESKQDRRDREAWNRDINALRAPEVKAAQSAAFAAIDVAKTNPEAAAQQFKSYCNLLLDLGQRMVHVQELQLGYWVDRLTATLVRLKQWREALEWLDRYFALPGLYRGRSSASEEDRLRKRQVRCGDMLRRKTSDR
jgi:hypothetical protein